MGIRAIDGVGVVTGATEVAPADSPAPASSAAAPVAPGLAPSASNTSNVAGAVPSAPVSTTSVANDDGLLAGFGKRFIEMAGNAAVQADLKQKLKLAPGVKIVIENRLLSRSTDPNQQAFLDAHAGGRILRQLIRIEGDQTQSFDAASVGVSGRAQGSYELLLEVPVESFKGRTVNDFVTLAKARLDVAYDLVRLPSGKFWRSLGDAQLPQGTHIARRVIVDGQATANSSTSTRAGAVGANAGVGTRHDVAFDVSWTSPERVNVTVDALRTDDATLGLTFAQVGASASSQRSNRGTRRYTDLEVRGPNGPATTTALEAAFDWANGLLPSRIDTQGLDALRKGRRSVDALVQRRASGNVYVPVGQGVVGGSVSGGGGAGQASRVSVEVADHRPDGSLVSQNKAESYADAMANRDVEVLSKGLEGLMVQRVDTGDVTGNLGASLSAGASLVSGYLGVGAVASFGASITDTHIVGTRVRYDERDPSRADVTVWKVDSRVLARNFAAEVGLTLDAQAETHLAEAMREHLLSGVGLERFSGQLAGAAVESVQSFLDKMKLRFAYSRTATEEGYEALHFARFHLDESGDRAAFAALIRGDAGPALGDGHLVETVTQASESQATSTKLSALGVNLLVVDTNTWREGEAQSIKVGDAWHDVRRYSAGTSQRNQNITEDNTYRADHFTVSFDGRTSESVTKVRFESQDDMVRGPEVRRIRRSVAASGYDVVKLEEGDGGWWLKWLLGKKYGEGRIDLTGVITGAGHREILTTSPEQARRTGLFVASRFMETGIPPSEASAVEAPSTAAARQALADAGWNASLGNLERARKALKKVSPELAAMSDATLDALLYRQAAGYLVGEYRRLSSQASSRDDHEKSDIAARYRALTRKREGSPRDIGNDAWIIEQADAFAAVFEQPQMVAARQRLARGEDLTPDEVKALTGEVFVAAAERARPSRLAVESSRSEAALVFWGGLFAVAGAKNTMALFSVDAERYDLIARSPNLNQAKLDEAVARHGAMTVRELRQRLGVSASAQGR